ncbi:MAG: hypothetical protein EB078_00900 [Proteobacteria bacterium]|nr:hypothetical protein [Pseudomonadota bacterium]NDC22959.1 hypothetical protein [Pseudomonadota bacterium]NDD03436.1 hypothetical protein [Pseudomonadota bacterium]
MKEIQIEQDICQNPTLNSQTADSSQGFGVSEATVSPIQTLDTSVWAATGLDIALGCLERVKSSLIRSAELFREEDSAEANRFFVQCIEGLQRFMEALKLTKAALKLDFATVNNEMGTLADTEKSLLVILRGMFKHQESKEYEEIADKIEYELITNLCVWTSSLTALRHSQLIDN